MPEVNTVQPLKNGWYEFCKYPEATMHIAYVQEGGGIYLPEDDVNYGDFYKASERGRAYRLIREPVSTHPQLDDWPVEEWRPITSIPTGSFEINRAGDIRNRHTKVVIEPRWSVDVNKVCVQLTINTIPYWVDGPQMADDMWTPAIPAN